MVKIIERSVTVTSTKVKPDHPHGGPPGQTEPPPVTEPPPETGALAWSQLKVGAGGWVTGIEIAADGTKVIRCDTFGAYALSPGETVWRLVLSATAMPAGDWGFDANGDTYIKSQEQNGVYEICIAPSDNAVFYMLFNGRVYRSPDRGATWARTAFTQVTGCQPNGLGKTTGRKMAVDPANADVCFVGTANHGLFKTTDGGATWTHDETIPSAESNYGIVIAFDRSSPSGVYVSSYGHGVYHSADGGSSWTVLSTGAPPADHFHMVCSPEGVLWLTVSTGTVRLWKYVSGVWTNSFASGSLDRVESIAIDPADANKIYLGQDYGGLVFSSDGGVNWSTSQYGDSRVASDIPWLAVTNETYMSNGDMAFDPSQSQVLYFAEGIGVWKSTSPPTANMEWISQSAGIEQLVATWVLWPPGGHPSVTAWDRPCFYLPDLDSYPAVPQPTYNPIAIMMGWHIGYAPSDPSKLVGLFNYFGNEQSGYSTDGGSSWTAFAAYPPTMPAGYISGSIETKDGTTIVWVTCSNDGVGNHGQAYYSTDGGASWSVISISGVPTAGEVGWGGGYNSRNHRLCVDANGDFYMYNNGSFTDASYAAVYKSSNGSSWTPVRTGQFTNYDRGGSVTMKAVPGNTGHMFASESGGDGALFGSLWRTTDGWATSSPISNVAEVRAFGFGMAKPGGSGYPTVFFAGWLSTVWGIYRSDDACATWAQIGDFPDGNIDDTVTCLDGDKDNYGPCIVGFNNSGWARYG